MVISNIDGFPWVILGILRYCQLLLVFYNLSTVVWDIYRFLSVKYIFFEGEL